MKRWACIVKSAAGVFTVQFGSGGRDRESRQFNSRPDAESYARNYLLWG